MAACGIDCTRCNIRRAENDPDQAARLVEDFRSRGHADAKPEWFRCSGCRGDRSQHWSDSCELLRCCVDQKGLTTCNQCTEFPCEKLVAWAGKNSRYSKALNRLEAAL